MVSSIGENLSHDVVRTECQVNNDVTNEKKLSELALLQLLIDYSTKYGNAGKNLEILIIMADKNEIFMHF